MSTEAERFLGIQGDEGPASRNKQPLRKPICNILALVFPLLITLVHFIGYFAKPDAWGIGAVLIIILLFCFTIPVSLLFAIISLFRRERFVALTIIEVVTYSSLVCLMISQVTR